MPLFPSCPTRRSTCLLTTRHAPRDPRRSSCTSTSSFWLELVITTTRFASRESPVFSPPNFCPTSPPLPTALPYPALASPRCASTIRTMSTFSPSLTSSESWTDSTVSLRLSLPLLSSRLVATPTHPTS
ncbi:hypothetical protein PENTCL1PPCAC_15366, partial [Pristionchus entomophagus]